MYYHYYFMFFFALSFFFEIQIKVSFLKKLLDCYSYQVIVHLFHFMFACLLQVLELLKYLVLFVL